MRKSVVGLVALFLVVFVVGMVGQIQQIQPRPLITYPPQAKATADEFMKLLAPCVRDAQFVGVYNDPWLPGGCYCMYYQDDPAHALPNSTHGFGWSSYGIGYGALYELVRGPVFTCFFKVDQNRPADPHQLLPPTPAKGFWVPFGKIQFWLNNPSGRPAIQGLYFTDSTRNLDGMQHAYIFHYRFPYPLDGPKCPCDCVGVFEQFPLLMGMPRPVDLYVIVWEDFWEDWWRGCYRS